MSLEEASRPVDPTLLGVSARILEGIVTTVAADGSPHVAPMGPIVEESMDFLWLRPFRTSTTFQNLARTEAGVFHITDDVELLARAAIGELQPMPDVTAASAIEGFILADGCRWYAFVVEGIDDTSERTDILARVVDRGINREFFGFNRAKHAVVEAAILATRVHLLPREEIVAEFDRLAVLVDKTGAAAEHRAMGFLRSHVENAAALQP